MVMINVNTENKVRLDQLLSEINSKADLYKNLVGSLYPGIVYQELIKLRYIYLELGGQMSNLPDVHQPSPEGYAR